MDVGQLLARMNPRGVNYMGIPGGVPELTTSDIAGALAFVPKGLGRSVLEAVYWPDGATLRSSELLDEVMKVVLPELARQAQQLCEASLDVQLIQMAIRYTRANPTAIQQQALTRAQLRLDALKSVAWPKNTIERIPLIVKAITSELSGAIKCESCNGRGVVEHNGLFVICKRCNGVGCEKPCDRKRALEIQCNSVGYFNRWKRVYEWIYEKICMEKHKSEKCLKNRLFEENATV